jgi:predicted nucleotidyltransferase
VSPRCDHERVPGISSVNHLTGHPQRWPEVDADIGGWVEWILAEVATALGEELVGVYLHGSLAMGCYYRPKSDLDLLIVCRDSLSPAVREKVARGLLAASDSRPTTGDIEASAMRVAVAREFVHPSPYEVHFSSDGADAIRDGRADYEAANTDPDLAAH